MQELLAFCGLNCTSCPIHLATLEPDDARRLSMRQEIARLCREQYGMEVQIQDVTDCDGCTAGTGRLFFGCAKCEIRRCAVQRELASCGRCSDYACEKLRKHFAADPSARDRLEILRSAGPD